MLAEVSSEVADRLKTQYTRHYAMLHPIVCQSSRRRKCTHCGKSHTRCTEAEQNYFKINIYVLSTYFNYHNEINKLAEFFLRKTLNKNISCERDKSKVKLSRYAVQALRGRGV